MMNDSDSRSGKARRNPPALKRLGQNFLSDPSILGRIADSLELTGRECVVEIGAGRGSLTAQLARRCRRLVAIEIDRALAPLLREKFAGSPHVEVVEGDALELSLADLAAGPYRLTGNVPYYITTPLMFHALTAPRPELACFLVQKEVAERAAAPPGDKTYGALSVNLQAFAAVELLFTVPPGAFVPKPKVDSAVLRLRPRPQPLVAAEDEKRFRIFVQAAFAQRRKQLRRILRSTHAVTAEKAERVIRSCELDPSIRPEMLRPEDFAALLAALI